MSLADRIRAGEEEQERIVAHCARCGWRSAELAPADARAAFASHACTTQRAAQ